MKLSAAYCWIGQTGNRPLQARQLAYNDKVQNYNYNPQRPRTAARGRVDEVEPRRRFGKDGKPFVFEIVTNQGNETRQKCAEIIQRQLADIGITVKIRILEWSAICDELYQQTPF